MCSESIIRIYWKYKQLEIAIENERDINSPLFNSITIEMWNNIYFFTNLFERRNKGIMLLND